MRLRELTFPILIRHQSELEGGRGAGLHSLARFDWSLSEAYTDGRYDNVEIIDSSGSAYLVEKILFMRPTIWRWLLDRLGHFLILPSFDKREVVRIDMELTQTRTLTLNQFKAEFGDLILKHPAWWRRHLKKDEAEALFVSANTFAEAINEIGFLSPADFMVYRGKSEKIVDLRR